jgi:formylglycine-generating enzyme required for sulfatase activity
MHGNALEWTLDRYNKQGMAKGATVMDDIDDVADMKKISGDGRALRGGSFITTPEHLIPSAKRAMDVPSVGDQTYGFRLARTVNR